MTHLREKINRRAASVCTLEREREDWKVYLGLWGKTDWISKLLGEWAGGSGGGGVGWVHEGTLYKRPWALTRPCNTLGNEKMVGRNFLSSRLSLSLILTISPLTDVKKSIRYFGQNWRWLERTNEQMNKWTNEQMNTAPLERTNKWTNEQMNTAPLEQMNKWTLLHLNKWTNEHCSAWKSTNLGPIL